jgi:hypothetical protein
MVLQAIGLMGQNPVSIPFPGGSSGRADRHRRCRSRWSARRRPRGSDRPRPLLGIRSDIAVDSRTAAAPPPRFLGL